MSGVTRRSAMTAGAFAGLLRPMAPRAADPGARPPPVVGEVDAGAVRFRYVSEIVEKPGAHGLPAVKNEVRNTGTAGLHFSWEKAGLVHFPEPLPAGGEARAWPSAAGHPVRLDGDAPLLFDGEPNRRDARAYVTGPAATAPRPDGPGAAAASTKIASAFARPGGALVGFDAQVEIEADGSNVRYTASVSPPSFSLAFGGVVELLGSEEPAVRAAAEQGYKARVSSFDAMLRTDGAKTPANRLRGLPVLSGRLLTIEPDAARDGQISLTFRTRFERFQVVERAFVVLGPTGEPVVAGIVMGLAVPRG